MRITDLLDVRSISLNAAPADKSQTLDAAVSLMTRSGKINDEEAYRKQVYAREEESTTGIGEGIAIPHGKCDAVEKPGLAAMVIPGGVDFDSLDGEPVTLLFLIAAPNTEDNVHLDVLSKLSMMLMDEEFTKSLRAAKTPEEFLAIIDQADEEKLSRRSLHTAPKSIRGRLLSYFSQEMVQQGSSQFMIPFNRQELADYLGVDRSALSNELGKMRKEGIIEVNRNQIHYLERV